MEYTNPSPNAQPRQFDIIANMIHPLQQILGQRSDPFRVAIMAPWNELPGDRNKRHLFVAETFCKQVLGRPFRRGFEWDSEVLVFDYIHEAGDESKTQHGVYGWLFLDLNVFALGFAGEVSQLPILIYRIEEDQPDVW